MMPSLGGERKALYCGPSDYRCEKECRTLQRSDAHAGLSPMKKLVEAEQRHQQTNDRSQHLPRPVAVASEGERREGDAPDQQRKQDRNRTRRLSLGAGEGKLRHFVFNITGGASRVHCFALPRKHLSEPV